jgi:DNA-binding response OmpR family regulator
MCSRCEELEEEVAYLKSELGLQADADLIESLRRAMPLGGLASKAHGAAHLVAALYRAHGRTLTRDQLMERLPSRNGRDDRDDKLCAVYVCAARKTLGHDGIQNVWGRGYRLTDAGMAKVAALLGPIVSELSLSASQAVA